MARLRKFRYLVVCIFVACYGSDTPTAPVERTIGLNHPSRTVAVDSFSVLLAAQPADSAVMHTYPDAVYAEVRVIGYITLHTNPTAPGFFGPVNNTNGPVYAYGSFVSGGSCGLNVTIKYSGPSYYGTSKLAAPCDQHHDWVDTLLVQGTGKAVRGGAISEPGATCLPMPCHWQEGTEAVWIKPVPTELVFSASARFVAPSTTVSFSVSANPNVMPSGGGMPRRVTAWRWRRASTSYNGPDTTAIGWYCTNQTAQSCSLPIKESGTMTVDAIVNGVAQSKSVFINVIPCPTGDTLVDDFATRSGLTAAWAQSNANGPISLRLERGSTTFDSTSLHVFRLTPVDPGDTPCRNANIPQAPYPGIPIVESHIHPFSVGDSLPSSCNLPNQPPGSYVTYGNKYGGPSGADWHRTWTDSLPEVIGDKDSLYRIYPYPIDSSQQNGNWVYYPKPGWQTNYFSAPRVSGTCTRF